MLRRTSACLALGAVLAVGGCTGGGGGTPTSSPGTASPAEATWRSGEIRTAPDLCSAVSPGVLRRLRLESHEDCRWWEDARGNDLGVRATLTVYSVPYQPAMSAPQLSATEEARRGYRTPPHGWARLDAGVPVPGLGDEAKLQRTFNPAVKRRGVVLLVRWRNVVIQLETSEEALLAWGRGRVPPVGDVEAGTVGAARDMLTRLGAPPAPTATAPAYGPDDVRTVRKICDLAAPTASRLAPGVTRHDITPSGTRLDNGCDWSENDGELPSLTVEAEAIAPSPATGETATRLATELFDQWKRRRDHAPKLGDEAKIDHFNFESGRSRSSSILVRRGNLLVYVDYGRWHHPSQAAMDREVFALAKAVLADQR